MKHKNEIENLKLKDEMKKAAIFSIVKSIKNLSSVKMWVFVTATVLACNFFITAELWLTIAILYMGLRGYEKYTALKSGGNQ
jgi:type IV secretory pathway component VirB8